MTGSGGAPTMPAVALAETAARLGAADAYAGFEVCPPPDGWITLDTAETDGRLDAWLDALVTTHGRRNVAGSMLAVQLGEIAVGLPVAAMLADDRCPDPAVTNLAGRLHPEGYLDGRAVRTPTVAVLPTDPAAGRPDSVVMPDEAAMTAWWAARTAATLGPLLAAVRARAPFSLRNLWGVVADEVAGTAVWVAQLTGRDPRAAWQRSQRLLDALAEHAPYPLGRGALFPVAHPCGERMFQVRGTCCLYYRSAAVTGPPSEAFCNTCPLRDDESRLRRLHDHLTATAESAA
jgi:hypothetical protein